MELARDTRPIDEAAAPNLGQTAVDAGSPSMGAGPSLIDDRSILRLQRTAGNRAVGALLRARTAPGARPDASRGQVLQRDKWGDEDLGPTEEPPIPGDFEPPSIQWPSNDAQGEPNEPCFSQEAQAMIGEGAAEADVAASHLFTMPPDLPGAVKEMEAALAAWEQVAGEEPGMGLLTGAKDKLAGAGSRVSVYVTPVAEMLARLSKGAQTASSDAEDASSMLHEEEDDPKHYTPPEEKPPAQDCFDVDQKAVIAEGVALADVATTELDKRPPDYRAAFKLLDDAAVKLGGVGGKEPGQAKLTTAVTTLSRVADVVEAYLDPVESVVSAAATDVQDASAAARDASEAAKRGSYAPGSKEPKAGEEAPGGAEPPPAAAPTPPPTE
jgi:hypothetical protein